MIKIKFTYLFVQFLLIIILSFYTIPKILEAQSEYDTVAQKFLMFLNCRRGIVSRTLIESNEINPSLSKVPIAYLVNLEDGGFILISTSRDLTPVKAYSLETDFKALPKEYTSFLLLEMEHHTRAVQDRAQILKRAFINDEIQKRWDFLLNYHRNKIMYKDAPGTILLTTRWMQKSPYNKFLPKINDKHALAGCLSVALAQIMKYHRFPSSGNGVVSYNWNGQNIKAVFYKNYHWENMPDIIDMQTPIYKEDEVARLIKDLAIANKTDFSLDASTAIVNIAALIKHFWYSTEVDTLTNSDPNQFFATIKNEIDACRPVLLHFPGHVGVADGYGSDDTGNSIHVNFGWGGKDDGFFYLDQNIVTKNHLYSPDDLKIYYNIKSCSGPDCYMNLEAEDSIHAPNIYGRFHSAIDTDEYEVYLKGPTTIRGTRYHYLNQAFFLSVYDSKNNFITSDDDTISGDLAADRYRLMASLCLNAACYHYNEIYMDYAIYITTNTLTNEEKIEIESHSDIPPVINNHFKDMIINSKGDPYMILIDAMDENGDDLSLTALSTHRMIHATIDENDILTIKPNYGISNVASWLMVRAVANHKSVEKSFFLLVLDEDISFGREFQIIGTFLDQNTFNKHKVILDGPCIISEDNRFSDPQVYTCVMDTNENFIVNPSDVEIQSTFSQGLYIIGVSLWSEPKTTSGDFFPYQENIGNTYRITVSCPDATDDISVIAQMLGLEFSEILPEGVGLGYQYASIQDAIDHAAYDNTIIVHDGIYLENIKFKGKAIALLSENGPSTTIIDGNSVGSVVTFNQNEDANSVLRGFTIRNGRADKGGGIFCQDSCPTIIHCFIRENEALLEGGGICCHNVSTNIINCLFWGNTSQGVPNQITLEMDAISYRDIQILEYPIDASAHMQAYIQEKGKWSSKYGFFKKACGNEIPIKGDTLFFISYFSQKGIAE